MTVRREPIDQPTPAEIEELSKVTPSDVDRAVARWKRNAPPEFRDLLDSDLVDEKDRGRSR